MPRRRARIVERVTPELVDAVRTFVERIAEDYECSDVQAVQLVSLAVARVAGEVATSSLQRELSQLLRDD